MKRVPIYLLSAILTFGAYSFSSADTGNTICPVTGEKIDPQNKATYEYEGKIINFCCPACIEEFKKDPEKYIKKIDEELKSEPKDKSQTAHHDMNMMQGAGMSDKGMHEKEGH